MSLLCRVRVDEERLTLEYDAVRLGAVPVPRSWVAGVTARTGPPAGANVRVERDGTLRVRNEFVWPNGRRRYRVASVAASDGVARVTLEPMPGH